MGHPSVKDRIEQSRHGVALFAEQSVTRLKVRSVVFLLLAVCLSMTAIVIWEAWNSRQYHLHDKEVAMSNLAQTLASQAQASIKQADTLLFTLVDRLEIDGITQGQVPRLERLLTAQRSELSQIHGLFVYEIGRAHV